MPKEVRVFAPATVANVSCGFDVFGFALDTPGDEVVARLSDASGVRLSSITGDGGRLPRETQKNTAGAVVVKLLAHLDLKIGVEIELHKKMPLGSGLGSSAASAVGALIAVNTLLGNPLGVGELLPFAIEGERIACGAGHADNVAPALLGGFVVVKSYDPLEVIKIPCGISLYCTIMHPHIEIHTESARRVLPEQISLNQHIVQVGNAASLIAGLVMGDDTLVGKSLHDVITEPVRSSLIPGFQAIKEAALAAGALGAGISGSGPSMFALSLFQKQAEEIGEAMFRSCPKRCSLYISKLNEQGPRVME